MTPRRRYVPPTLLPRLDLAGVADGYARIRDSLARSKIFGAAGGALLLALAGMATVARQSNEQAPAALFSPTIVTAPAPLRDMATLLTDTLVGASGALRARFIVGEFAHSYPGMLALNLPQGSTIPIRRSEADDLFHLVRMLPFERKFGDRVGSYLVGYWPGESRAIRTEEEHRPLGFIEVTQANRGMKVSEHFTLEDFLTHDQQHGWPRYLVLQELLLDKLELVIAELKKSGVTVRSVRVMSGFRTPYHNSFGIGSEGGARDSRHMYGDATDIIIDNNRDGRMDDLNNDRRVDTRDLDLVLQAVERVERNHPHLVGGLGKYHAVGPSGPFAHIDVRGYRARWENGGTRVAVAGGTATGAAARRSAGTVQNGEAVRVSRCNAAPEFAALCGGER